MNQSTRNILLLSTVLLLSACASAPAPKPDAPEEEGKAAIVHHKCDEFGVSELQIVVTGPGVYTIGWSNKGVRGYPS